MGSKLQIDIDSRNTLILTAEGALMTMRVHRVAGPDTGHTVQDITIPITGKTGSMIASFLDANSSLAGFGRPGDGKVIVSVPGSEDND